jgi:acyl carrier protein
MVACICKSGCFFERATPPWRALTRKGVDSMDTTQKMIDIIVEQLNVEKDKVVPGASFVDDLGADSLDLVELIMAMEEGFDIEIPDEDAEKISTVQDAINYVEKLKNA